MKNFVLGRNDVSVTIFVPWNCRYNCKFCTSKQMYAEYENEDQEILLDNVIRTIKAFNSTSIEKFVITGGEPLSNLEGLEQILNAIDKSKDIYINTSLPSDSKYIEFLNNHPEITSISVSRHETDFKLERVNSALDFYLERIRQDLPIRINCVCYHNFSNPNDLGTFLKKFIERFSCLALPDNSSINFRADYTKIKTLEDLKGFNDEIVQKLATICKYKFSNGCNVCNNDVFNYYGKKVVYHRGFEHTCQTLGNTVIVNDVIILPNGEWYYDWDKKEEDKDRLLSKLYIEKIKKDNINNQQVILDSLIDDRAEAFKKGIELNHGYTSGFDKTMNTWIGPLMDEFIKYRYTSSTSSPPTPQYSSKNITVNTCDSSGCS